jgi:putative Ca2+/H+ antiporter (TMEM165/GDT1 family)
MNIVVLFTVFGIIFLGELGDRSQLIIFNLVLELDEKPYKVGIGASLGFAVIISIGILFGNFITEIIPIFIISIISGLVFIIIGILETKDLKTLYYNRKTHYNESQIKNNRKTQKNSEESILRRIKNPYLAGFLSIFIMELGDKTQILTISFTSFYSLPLEVWLGSFLALSSLAWIGVSVGSLILKYIPKFYLKVVTITIFISIGAFIIISNLI